MTLTIGSLCSGYGGLDMAVMDVLDAEVAWHAQYDPDDKHQYAARILARHWPGVPNHGDITAVPWADVEPVDILTAGFPCQPVSAAGKNLGDQDDRWLWPDVAAAVRALRPRLVFLENVSAILVRGFGAVADSLAALGYDFTWTCLRASDVGAPHRRERWFCLAWPAADTENIGYERSRQAWRRGTGLADGGVAPPDSGRIEPERRGGLGVLGGHAPKEPRQEGQRERAGNAVERRGPAAADADNTGARPELDRQPERPEGLDEHEVLDPAGRVLDWGFYGPAIARWERVMGRCAPAPTEPGWNGPRLAPRFVEWLMGCPEGHITDVPGIPRNAQLKAGGNGVVRQQGAEAFRRLLARREVPAHA